MDTSLRLAGERDAHVIANLWPLYQHDVSEFDGVRPNRHGIFGAGEEVDTLALHARSLDAWWKAPGVLFPYLILADGRPAGFNLVATGPHLPEGVAVDFVVHEFFVLHAYRGCGVAERAAAEGFALHRGRWEVVTYPSQARAIAFWRRVVSRHGNARFTEREMDHPWGRKVVFRFDNTAAPA
jgi:predicted acetyltransferase